MGQLNIRVDDVTEAILTSLVDELKSKGVKTDKSDVVRKALFSFARDYVLGNDEVSKIIDKNYNDELGIYKVVDK